MESVCIFPARGDVGHAVRLVVDDLTFARDEHHDAGLAASFDLFFHGRIDAREPFRRHADAGRCRDTQFVGSGERRQRGYHEQGNGERPDVRWLGLHDGTWLLSRGAQYMTRV